MKSNDLFKQIKFDVEKDIEIAKLFHWSEVPHYVFGNQKNGMLFIEYTYKEFSDDEERKIIDGLLERHRGKLISDYHKRRWYKRYIDKTIEMRLNELEEQFSKSDLDEKSREEIISELEKYVNQNMVKSSDGFDTLKSSIMKYISKPNLSIELIDDLRKNEEKKVRIILETFARYANKISDENQNQEIANENLFESFFKIDPALKYIDNLKALKKKIPKEVFKFVVYKPIHQLNDEYRDKQSKKNIVILFKATINQISDNFTELGYDDTIYIIMPLLFYITDFTLQLKTQLPHKEKIRELLDLQSYLFYKYYDYAQLNSFKKIENIWLQILTQTFSARGDWWSGVRTRTKEENRNFLFQFILVTGDLLFAPSLTENYFDAPTYIVNLSKSTEMSNILTRVILPLIVDYLDKIQESFNVA